MTSPDQPGQPSQETHEPSQDTLRQPAGRFSLRRGNSAWLGITLSLTALVAVSAALIAVATGSGTHQATSSASGGPSTAAGAAPGSIKAIQAPSGISEAKGNFPSAAQVAESGGALSLPANMQNRVITWQFSPGGSRLAAMSSLFGTALQERGLRQPTACRPPKRGRRSQSPRCRYCTDRLSPNWPRARRTARRR